MILEVRNKLTINSISIAIINKQYKVTEIPFPAVTIVGPFQMMLERDIGIATGLSKSFYDWVG